MRVFRFRSSVTKKNGITSLGSVFINKQFAIIPLRTFKCKKRMFSSSADVTPHAKISGSSLGSKGRRPTNSNWSLFVDVSHSQLARETAAVYFTSVSTFLLSRVRTNIYRISRESIFASTEFSLPSTRFKQL